MRCHLRYVFVLLGLSTMRLSQAQIGTEGMGAHAYGDVVKYVLDRQRHRARELRLEHHWGGEGEKRPPFNDRILIRFTGDTLAYVDYGHGSYDSLRSVRGEWWSTWQLDRLSEFRGTVVDSVGVRIVREVRVDADSITWWSERRSRNAPYGWNRSSRSLSSTGALHVDSTWQEESGWTRTTYAWSTGNGDSGSGSAVWRVAEVVPGLFMRVFLEQPGMNTFLEHRFDRHARLQEVIVREMDPSTGSVSGRDRLTIRYRDR